MSTYIKFLTYIFFLRMGESYNELVGLAMVYVILAHTASGLCPDGPTLLGKTTFQQRDRLETSESVRF